MTVLVCNGQILTGLVPANAYLPCPTLILTVAFALLVRGYRVLQSLKDLGHQQVVFREWDKTTNSPQCLLLQPCVFTLLNSR